MLVANSRWDETIFGHILHANKLDPQNATFTSSIIGFQKYLATGQYAGLSTDIISRKMLSDKRLDLKIVSSATAASRSPTAWPSRIATASPTSNAVSSIL